MIKKIRICAAALAAVMLIGLTGCKDTNTTALTVEGVDVSSGVYLTFLTDNYLSAFDEEEVSDVSSADQLWDKQIGGKNAEQWIIDKTIQSAKKYVGVNKLFDELGLSLSDTDKSAIDNSLESIWSNYQNMYEPNGSSKASVRKVVENQYKSDLIFKKYYDKGGLEEVSDDSLREFFKENFAKIKFLTAPLKDTQTSQPLSDAAKEELKTKLQGYAERVNNGEDIDLVIDEYTAEQSASDSSASSSESAETSDSSQTEEEKDPDRYKVILYKDNTSYPEDFRTKVFEMEQNKAMFMEIENFYLLIERFDVSEDEKDFTTARQTALYAMKNKDFEDKINEYISSYNADLNDAAIKRFTPKNVNKRTKK